MMKIIDNQSKYKIWDGKKFRCPTCGKNSTLGLEMEGIFEAEKLPWKAMCIDCAMELSAQVQGVCVDDLLKVEEETRGTYNLFMEIMVEEYFKENEKKKFDSIQEESIFLKECLKGRPKGRLLN